MGLFNFVQKDQAVWVVADPFGQLAGFFIADIARGRPDQFGDGVLLHEFGHVEADHGVFAAEHLQGQLLGQLGLADPGRANKEEGADWPAGLVEADPVSSDGPGHLVNGLVLADNLSLEVAGQVGQLFFFLCLDVADRDVGLFFHDLVHDFGRNGRGLVRVDVLVLQLLVFFDLVTVVGSFFVVFVLQGILLELLSRVDSFLDLFLIDVRDGQVHS